MVSCPSGTSQVPLGMPSVQGELRLPHASSWARALLTALRRPDPALSRALQLLLPAAPSARVSSPSVLSWGGISEPCVKCLL